MRGPSVRCVAFVAAWSLALLAACSSASPSAAGPSSTPAPRPDAGAPSAAAAELLQATLDVMDHMQQGREHHLDRRPDPDVEWRAGWSLRLARAQVDARMKSAADAARDHAARMAAELAAAQDLFAAGRFSEFDVAIVRMHVAEAKVLLERALATGSLRGD